jgi:hypothetical protein
MKFEISYHGGPTHEVELVSSVAVLGRDPACDVVLNDAKCSRRHAVVEDGPEGIVVRDTGSANGVYVNGKRVETARLRPGDMLRLGDVSLRLLAEIGETVVMAPEDLDLHAVAGTHPTPAPPRPLAPPPLAETSPPRRAPVPRVRPARPATVGVLVGLWALFVPVAVAGSLLAASRFGGPLAWILGALASLALAGLGTAMALGLRALASWARNLQIATAAIGLAVCPFTLASVTVLLYMTRPEVKAVFEGMSGRPAQPSRDAADVTFALSLVGMLVLGAALTAIAAFLL